MIRRKMPRCKQKTKMGPRRYWNSRAKSWHSVRTPEEIKAFKGEISRSLRGVKGAVVELMSGTMSYCPKAIALDFSAEMLKHNPQFRNGKTIQFDLNFIPKRRLPFSEGSAGAFIIVNATQYLKNPAVVFGELRRCLAKRGKMILIGSDLRGATGRELNNLNSEDLVTLLQKLGFKARVTPFNVFYSPKQRPIAHKAPHYKIEAVV